MLNEFLINNGFCKIGGVVGLANDNISVYTAVIGDIVIMLDNKEFFSSKNESEIIAVVSDELARKAAKLEADLKLVEQLIIEVANDYFVQNYYAEESSVGKRILIQNALEALNTEIPRAARLSVIQKRVEELL